MLFGLLAIAAIAIEVEPVLGVPDTALDELRVSLSRAVERRGMVVARSHGAGVDIVHLSVVGGRSRLEVLAERRAPDGQVTRAEIRGPLEGTWDDTMELLMGRLFPIEARTADAIAPSREPAPMLTYGLASFSVLSAGLAVGFSVAAADARDELRGPPKFGATLDDAVSKRDSAELAALSFAVTSVLLALACAIVAF